MTHLYIIRGAPGSGKTTLAQRMKASGMVQQRFEADMFMTENGFYRYNKSRIAECHAKCFEGVTSALLMRDDVAVSNTFTRLWEMKPYLDFCAEKGIQVTVIRLEGQFENVHNVPEEKVKEMRDRIEPYGVKE